MFETIGKVTASSTTSERERKRGSSARCDVIQFVTSTPRLVTFLDVPIDIYESARVSWHTLHALLDICMNISMHARAPNPLFVSEISDHSPNFIVRGCILFGGIENASMRLFWDKGLLYWKHESKTWLCIKQRSSHFVKYQSWNNEKIHKSFHNNDGHGFSWFSQK